MHRRSKCTIVVGALACAIVVIAGVCVPSGGQSRPAPATRPRTSELPQVRSLKELEALAEVDVGGGWRVRLAWASGGAEAGPWVLAYCQARYVGEGAPSVSFAGPWLGTALGPVFARLTRTDVATLRGREKISFQRSPLPKEAVYCCLVPLAWQGRYRLDIVTARGQMLAVAGFGVDRPQACLWQEFGWRDRRESAYSGPAWPLAAAPSYDGLRPVWPLEGPRAQLPEGPPSLPGQLPSEFTRPLPTSRRAGEAIEGLSLALADGQFVVKSAASMRTWPDLYLLARWWVNGKPIAAPLADGMSINISRAVTTGAEMKVPFHLPATLGQLKAGDKVEVQVMYSPGMVELLQRHGPDGGLGRAIAPDVPTSASPLLSNRLAFVVGAAAETRPATRSAEGKEGK
ncbi:MAG: hypothetical protein NTV86_15255 [Planctomycetota bacterium]|nr:hypothetical protein [Planctomycetota bacterium]